MSEPNQIVNVPRWLRLLSILVLGTMLFVATAVILHFLKADDREEYVLTAVALAQVASSGLVFLLLLFFSRRDLSISQLKSRTEAFLERDVKEALEECEWDRAFGKAIDTSLTVHIQRYRSAAFRTYLVNVGPYQLHMRVALNVRQLVVIYYLSSSPLNESLIEQQFESTIRGAKISGYDYKIRPYAEDSVTGVEKCSITFINSKLKDETITDSIERLFWSQDIAMMTRDVLINAHKHNLLISKVRSND